MNDIVYARNGEVVSKPNYYTACMALDLFTKLFCKKDTEGLEFMCKTCPMQLDNGYCAAKLWKSRFCGEYKEFGSMGDL